ncbi:MAG: Asp-tRNA(Asn)/Glu-tRNA(Gln) amidotransferase subunit GatC [Bacteroidetes bacterium]|nr:MAG: Asp-tRNA(Asn)/Glu-tRNA(Gln) amidotransferase subunit GatC [Bacteroidota bacterium]
MAKITPDTVDKLATLSRLEFDGKEREEIMSDLNRMLDFVGKLNELNTTGVEPLIYMADEKNVLRNDEAKTDITQKQALSNAPKKDSDYFKVPKVVEKK